MLSQSVLSTLFYHSIFDYPLTINEIHRYLISDSVVSLAALKEEISSLLKTGKILLRDGFFNLSSIVTLRLRRQKISAEKMMIAERASKVISIIPWVKMAAVTGALAMENADENDDIDLMVVTSKDRLWIARPLAILFVSLFFKRRKPSNFSSHSNRFNHSDHFSYKNHICPNLWLDESALEIPVGQRNLYTAHELAQMKPIVNKGGIYERMMAENFWGKKYLANVWKNFNHFNHFPAEQGPASQDNHFFPFNFLNILAFKLQLWYMRPKMSNEKINLHSAFFHPGNRADTILDKYDRLCHRSF